MHRLVRLITVALAVAFVAGCARPVHHVSPQQRLASWKAPLRRITRISDNLARDTQWLSMRSAQGRVVGVRRAAYRLRADGHLLCSATGRAGYGLRLILGLRTSWQIRDYIRDALLALGLQWDEGRTLQRVAVLAWHDPYFSVGLDSQRLYRLMVRARRDAAGSVRASARANRFLRRHRAAFRYIFASGR